MIQCFGKKQISPAAFLLILTIIIILTGNVCPQNTGTVSTSFNLKDNKNNSLFYVREDGRIGMGLTSPEASLHVMGPDGFLFNGNINKGVEMNPGPGIKMMWYPRKAAFRAGGVDGRQWDDRNIGLYSMAGGYMVSAGGDYSVALGINNTASGQASVALGRNSTATSFFSLAAGFYSTALNEAAFSLGYHTNADGKYSFAMGYKSSTNGKTGAFSVSDASSQASLNSSADNEISMRFAGGYRLFSGTSLTAGTFLFPEGVSWSVLADSGKMANIRSLNYEKVLSDISRLNAVSWSLRGSKSNNRHYGISAQSFYKYFGHDSLGIIGNDTTISTSDFDAITLAAIKALEKRTSDIRSTIASVDTLVAILQSKDSLITKLNEEILLLNEKLSAKESELESINSRLEKIEATLINIREPKGRKQD